jgi:UDP-GlcNAc:undecaprenyl-phosphate GlcNAc-1-phosphate transferase
MYFLTLAGCVLAACSTGLICAYANTLGRVTGLLDRPDGVRKLHDGAVPLMGGLAIALPCLLLALAYIIYVYPDRMLIAVAISLAAVALVGALDDRFGLGALTRMGLLAAIVLVAFFLEPDFVLHAVRIDFLNLEMNLGVLAPLFTLLIIIGFVNAVNLADGMNGQFLGSLSAWCGFMLVYAPDQRTVILALLCSTLVALLFNLRGKLFAGSVGSYALSLFIGLSAIALYRRSYPFFPGEMPVYWFWLPVADCLRLFAWRMLNGRSPFAADRSHIHHVLSRLTGHNGQAVLIYLALLAAPGVIAIFSAAGGILALASCIVLYVLLLTVEKAQRLYTAVLPQKSELPAEQA